MYRNIFRVRKLVLVGQYLDRGKNLDYFMFDKNNSAEKIFNCYLDM